MRALPFTLVLLIRKMNDGFHLITQIILSTLTIILSLGVCSNCVRKKTLASQCQDQFKSANTEVDKSEHRLPP